MIPVCCLTANPGARKKKGKIFTKIPMLQADIIIINISMREMNRINRNCLKKTPSCKGFNVKPAPERSLY